MTDQPIKPATDEEIKDRAEYGWLCDCGGDDAHAPLCDRVFGPSLLARIDALKAEVAEVRALNRRLECRTCDGDGMLVVRADGIAVSAPCPNCR